MTFDRPRRTSCVVNNEPLVGIERPSDVRASPNITGGFTLDVVSVGRFGIADVQGSFTAAAPYDILFDPGASQGKQNTRAEFSAASSNAIYSGSSSVQPPALLLLPCIKV